MLTKNIFRLSVLFITLFMLDISMAQPVTVASVPALFSDAGTAKPKVLGPKTAFPMKFRYARLNIGVLFDSKWQAKGSDKIPKIRFNLFRDADFIGTVSSEVDEQLGMTGWGGVMNVPGSFSLVASKEDGASMTIHAGARAFQVNCNEVFICTIDEEDTSLYPEAD